MSYCCYRVLHITDFDADLPKLHLDMLASNFPVSLQRSATVMDIRKHIQVMSSAEQLWISQVLTVLHLLLVMPATNASSERSFSALRRVKTYLHSTISQDRLNHIILLHCHKDLTDSLDLVAVANESVDLSSRRLGILADLQMKIRYMAVGFCGRRKKSLKCSSYIVNA